MPRHTSCLVFALSLLIACGAPGSEPEMDGGPRSEPEDGGRPLDGAAPFDAALPPDGEVPFRFDPVPDQRWTVGLSATIDFANYVTPTDGVTLDVSPAPPEGVRLEGPVLGGRPVAASAPTTYTATARRGAASREVTFSIEVVEPSREPSPLAIAASGVSAGQWVALAEDDPDVAAALTGSTNRRPLSEWMNKAGWWGGEVPGFGRVVFHGTPANSTTPWHTVVYREETNTWSREPGNLDTSHSGHAYDHNTMDPATGTLYSAAYRSNDRILRYDTAAARWIDELPTSSLLGRSAAYALVHHSAPRGLLWLEGERGQLAFWDEASDMWSEVANGLEAGSYHNVSAHNRTAEVSVLGGGNGSRQLHRVYHDGAALRVEALPPAPFEVVIINAFGSEGVLLAPNPNSTTFIAMTKSGQLWELDAGTSARAPGGWTRLPDAPAPFTGPDAALEAFVADLHEYGVLMYVKWRGSAADVLLYRPR